MTKLLIENVEKNGIRISNVRLQPLITWLHFLNFITIAVLCLIFIKIYRGFLVFYEWLFPMKNLYKNPIIMIIGPKNEIIEEMVYQLSQKFNAEVVDFQDLKDNCSQISTPKPKQSQIIYSYIPISSQELIVKICVCIQKKIGPIDILIIAQNEDVVENNSTESFLNHLNKQLLAQFWTVLAFLPGMLRRNCGHIISIALGRSSLTNTGIMRTIHEELLQSETNVKLSLVERNTFFDGYLPSLSNDILARLIIRSMWNTETVVKVPSLPCYLFVMPIVIMRILMKTMFKIVHFTGIRSI